MNKKIVGILICILFFGASITPNLLITTVKADSDDIIFSDDFESYSSVDDPEFQSVWTKSSQWGGGTISLVSHGGGKALSLSHSNHQSLKATTVNSFPRNRVVECDVNNMDYGESSNGLDWYSGILFAYISGTFGEGGSMVSMFYHPYYECFRIGYYSQGTRPHGQNIYKGSDIIISNDQWFKMKVEIDDTTFSCYYDVGNGYQNLCTLSHSIPDEFGNVILNQLGFDAGESVFDNVIVYGAENQPPTEGLVSYCSYDDSGDPGNDDSGNGNHGTLTGDAAWTSNGISGGSISLDGDGDYINYGDKFEFSEGTIGFWFKPAEDILGSLDYRQVLYMKSYTSDTASIHISIKDDGVLYFSILKNYYPSTWHHVFSTTTNWYSDSWYYITCVWDSSEISLYVNGDLEDYDTGTNGVKGSSYSAVIGAWKEQINNPNYSPFEGLIDEAHVYNRALSASEIEYNYNMFPEDENQPPVANAREKYIGIVNKGIVFDASLSYDPDGDDLMYRWDVDSNGEWDTDWISSSTISLIYNYAYQGWALLSVKDIYGQYDEDEAYVEVYQPFEDEDGDGLLNDWELNGYYGDDDVYVDLPTMGASLKHKDIFVEIDYMEPGEDGYSHKPLSTSINRIIDVFAKSSLENPDEENGIRLHVDYGSNSELTWSTSSKENWGDLSKSDEIDFIEYLGAGSGNEYYWSDEEYNGNTEGIIFFQDLKDQYFNKAEREQIFHYVIFCHNLSEDLKKRSGWSRNDDSSISSFQGGASDFVVACGAIWYDENAETNFNYYQSGTFMHELGHNLGLMHGGEDHICNKTNHLSVMNYIFQFCGLYKDGECFMDYNYSNFNLDNLDESSLNEPDGIMGIPSGSPKYGTRFWNIVKNDWKWIDDISVPIDWNSDNDEIDNNINVDINNDGEKTILDSTTEWDKIQFMGGSIGSGGFGDSLPSSTYLEEPNIEDISLIPIDYIMSISGPGKMYNLPGNNRTYFYNITNRGKLEDNYTIEISTIQNWIDINTIPTNIFLESGSSLILPITISVPYDTEIGVFNLLSIKVTSLTKSHIFDIIETITIIKDYTPPTSNITILTPKYGSNDEWITSATEFNLTATDDFSGVDETYYRTWFNNSWSPWSIYNGNFTLSNDGKHYIEYFSCDLAGNCEEIHNQTHYVDDKGPIITNLVSQHEPVEIGTTIVLEASFFDELYADSHCATIDWGDGNITNGTIDETNQTINGSHIYNLPSVYTINLTVEDYFSRTDSEIFQYIVVYDPSSGFVTGGGWINSPEGAYTPDPNLTGKANFGFVSKYKKGKQTPTGNTEFKFKAGDLNFHSNDYDWLVVTHHKAMYKGTGTINGDGNYGFLISVIDEELTESTDVDLFRIKIWDKDNNDEIIYDNMLGEDEDEDPTTYIGGGNIKIHKEN